MPGRHPHVDWDAATRCTRFVRTVDGRAGDIWVARVRVGVAYDWHDALNNEAVYARHYKYMATLYTPASGRVAIYLLHRL